MTNNLFFKISHLVGGGILFLYGFVNLAKALLRIPDIFKVNSSKFILMSLLNIFSYSLESIIFIILAVSVIFVLFKSINKNLLLIKKVLFGIILIFSIFVILSNILNIAFMGLPLKYWHYYLVYATVIILSISFILYSLYNLINNESLRKITLPVCILSLILYLFFSFIIKVFSVVNSTSSLIASFISLFFIFIETICILAIFIYGLRKKQGNM